MQKIINFFNKLVKTINLKIKLFLYTKIYYYLLKQLTLLKIIKIWLLVHIIYFILLILDQSLLLCLENYSNYSSTLNLVPNQELSLSSSIQPLLNNDAAWRLVCKSDLSKITESVLLDGWAEGIIDTNTYNIFNPRSHTFWLDDTTPLSNYYIENIVTGNINRLTDVWPLANRNLDSLGLPLLPFKTECVSLLDIHHQKMISNNSITFSELKTLSNNKISSHERIVSWLADQRTNSVSFSGKTNLSPVSIGPSSSIYNDNFFLGSKNNISRIEYPITQGPTVQTLKPTIFSETDYKNISNGFKGLELELHPTK